MRLFNPPHIAPPAATYSHGVEISPNARWLYVAGQVGTKSDGTIDAEIEGQAEQAWRNIVAILEGAGMGVIIWSKSRLSLRVRRTFRLTPKCATDISATCGRPLLCWSCRHWLVLAI